MATFTRCLHRSLALKKLFFPQSAYRILPVAYVHTSRVLFGTKGQEIKMPSLSPTMTEGTIIRWLKKEGDTVSPGDILCEIQTDKAVVGFEIEEEGVLAKILIPDDSKDVKIGTIIGLMVDVGDDWQNVEMPSGVTEDLAKEVSMTGVQGIEIKMPSLSPTMTEGTIVKWLKKEGDPFAPGDVLCEIQTDKAVVAFEIEEEGILAKILVPEDTKNVQLGTVIALMVREGENWQEVCMPQPGSEGKPPKKDDTHEIISSVALTIDSDEQPRLCGPSVRNLLHEYGIKYSLVTATGPHNIVLKGDVLNYISSKNLKPKSQEDSLPAAPDVTFVEEQNYIDIPHTSMRRTIAKRLTESKRANPHAYMSIDCVVDEVLKLQSQMKKEKIAVSVNDFIVKCAAEALVRVPEVNVIKFNNEVKKATSVDISIAVATEKGLITPIINQANSLGVQQISERVKALAAKARTGKLKPEEYQGGSFSISNLGMFGISAFTAVINPPQGAILAIGTSCPVFRDKKSITKMTVTLSFDGMLISDMDAARYLQCFKEHIENPFSMILSIPVQNAQNYNT